MPINDPATWVQAATAGKAAVEGINGAITLLQKLRGMVGGGNPQELLAIDAALAQAASNAAIAEAEIAKALGYELCKCEYPPVIMKTVGSFRRTSDGKHFDGEPVYECPRCGFNNAGGWAFTPLKPKE